MVAMETVTIGDISDQCPFFNVDDREPVSLIRSVICHPIATILTTISNNVYLNFIKFRWLFIGHHLIIVVAEPHELQQ